MALIHCPECSKEISSSAESCPECGHPIKSTAPADRQVVSAAYDDQSPFPKWIIAPIAILGALILFSIFYMLQSDERATNENIDVNVATERPIDGTRETAEAPPVDISTDTTINVPENEETTLVKEPENDQTIGADTKTEVSDSAPNSGSMEINARVADPKGNIDPVKAEKFYLLDKELSQILADAQLKPIRNESLVNSFGLSVLDPGKYGNFNKKALDAINEHIKYDTLTDSNGVAQIGNIKPDSYYIFGIHKVGKGFAVWSSPVSIKPGKNNLNIRPQKMQEYKG